MPILIVGVTTRAIAESARHAGHDVVTIDYFGDLDQKALCPNLSLRERGLSYAPHAFVELARDLSYEAVVYGGGFENHPSTVAELARGRALLGNPREVLEEIRSPQRLFSVLRAHGFAVPATADAETALLASGSWLCKPIRSGGGRGIRRWRGGRVPRDHLLEEYVAGLSASASFVADGERCVLLGVTRQLPAPRRFLYGGNIYPLELPPAAQAELQRIIDTLTRTFGLRGVNGIDFVLRDSRPVVVEVNPRYCASMELVERASSRSIFALHVAACQGRLPAGPLDPPAGVWGKRIVYASGAARVGDTATWLARGWRDIPRPGESFTRGQPICTVLAGAPTPRECEERLAAETGGVYASVEPQTVGGWR